jgi:hypothetical protein
MLHVVDKPLLFHTPSPFATTPVEIHIEEKCLANEVQAAKITGQSVLWLDTWICAERAMFSY